MFNNNLLMGAASAGGESLVEVGNSALFDSANSEYLSKTFSTPTDQDVFTFSTWLYRGLQGILSGVFAGAATNQDVLYFNSTDNTLKLILSASTVFETSMVFRDIGWYHIVWKQSGTSATLYVNGVSVATGTGTVNDINTAVAHTIGSYNGAANYYNGYIAETVFIDGLQLAPTSFGQYDSTGTFWTPKSSAAIKALTFGNNGFYLDNTTNAQTDASGEGNNFTNNNTVTLSTHTPTNLNALWNPLSTVGLTTRFPQLSAGNTTAGFSGSTSARAMLTLPVFYNTHLEFTVTQSSGSDTSYPYLQVFPFSTDDYNGDILVNQPAAGGSGGTGLASGVSIPNWTTGDRVTLEIDTTNGRIYVFIDGSAVNSANPGAGSGFTFDFTMPASGQLAIVWINQTSAGKTVVVSNPAEFTDSVSTGYFGLTSTIVAAQTTRTKSNLEEYFSTILYEGNGAGQRVGKFLPFTNAFTVGNSALFDDGDTELTRTPSSDGNLDAWTFSTWVKFCDDGDYGSIFGAGDSNTNQMSIYRLSDGAIRFQLYAGGSFVGRLITTQKFLDASRWYNVVVVWNSGSSDSGERMRIFVDGVRITSFSTELYPSQNVDGFVNDASYKHFIGNDTPALANASDIYLSQTVLLDGTTVANADNFGQVDTSTGRWIPKQITGLTMGTNGFFMDYAASGANLGDDAAGSIDYANDGGIQVSDTPTVNFAVFDSNFVQSGFVLSNGNQTADASSVNKWGTITLPITTGKWFGVATTTDVNTRRFGVASNEEDFVNLGTGVIPTDDEYAWAVFINNTTTIAARNDSTNITGTIQTLDRTNDRYAVAIDCDNRKVWLGIYDNSAGNIQWLDSGGTVRTTDVPASGVNETYILTGTSWRFFVELGDTGSAQTIDFGQSSFGGASLPSGFLGLNQDNMPEGESYQTAFSWIKNRDATDNHMLFDRVRGIYNNWHSNTADPEVTNVNTLQRFLNGGVQVGNDVQVNTANESYVAWNWYMETTGSGSSNTDGTINTTSTLVDTNLGLSISKYTGTGANATIGHGLGVAPTFVIIKRLTGSGYNPTVAVNVGSLNFSKRANLDETGAFAASSTFFQDTNPSSTVITLGNNGNVNASSVPHICYAFAPSQFISIGSYTGNDNVNGTFIPTVNSLGIPIQPAWTIVRRTDAANSWGLGDDVRDPFNPVNQYLASDNNAAEASYSTVDKDYVLGGFKARGTSAGLNASGGTYIYMAFGTPIIDVDGRIITGR